MSKKFLYTTSFIAAVALLAVRPKPTSIIPENTTPRSSIQTDTLPPPFATPSVRKNSRVIGWENGKMPVAPKGFAVTKFADGLNNPRWIYVADNGDIFVSEASTGGKGANRITLFKDANKDGVPENRQVFMEGLNKPFGMLILNNHFYVANTDGVLQFSYQPGTASLDVSAGKKIV
jgi:glucose/arabinose dehydrogenase